MEYKKIMFAWGKSLLFVYKYLSTVTTAIDELVIKQGLSSGYFGGHSYNSTYNCANKIIELTERKRQLINIKIIVDDALAELKPDDIKILVLTYFDGMKSVDVATQLGISLRTYFRRKNLAIVKFARMIEGSGFSHDVLSENLKDEEWLLSIFNKNLQFVEQNTLTNSSNDEQIITDFKLLKNIMKDLAKTTKKSYSYYI